MSGLFLLLLVSHLQRSPATSPPSDVAGAVRDGVGAVTKVAAIAEKGQLCAAQLTEDDVLLRDIAIKETDAKNRFVEFQRQLNEISVKLTSTQAGSSSWQELRRAYASTQMQMTNVNALLQTLANRSKQISVGMSNHQACVAQAYSALDALMK